MKLTKLYSYANLKESTDRTNPVIQANSSKIAALWTKVHTALSFIHNEILSLEEGTIEKYLTQETKLEPFRKSLLDILQKGSTRSLLKLKKHLLHSAKYIVLHTKFTV